MGICDKCKILSSDVVIRQSDDKLCGKCEKIRVDTLRNVWNGSYRDHRHQNHLLQRRTVKGPIPRKVPGTTIGSRLGVALVTVLPSRDRHEPVNLCLPTAASRTQHTALAPMWLMLTGTTTLYRANRSHQHQRKNLNPNSLAYLAVSFNQRKAAVTPSAAAFVCNGFMKNVCD